MPPGILNRFGLLPQPRDLQASPLNLAEASGFVPNISRSALARSGRALVAELMRLAAK